MPAEAKKHDYVEHGTKKMESRTHHVGLHYLEKTVSNFFNE
jgi:hypothetical protein